MTPLQILRARQSLGLSCQKLADKIGVSRSSVIKWERGERAPREIAIKAIKRLVEEADNAKAS